jgi:hypothetical protein
MSKKSQFILLFLFLLTSFSFSQNYEKKYTTVIPGYEYKANWLHKLFFGKHWRDLWTTPVEVEILDLDNFGGGLTPVKRGGGYQTKSLRLKGKDGKEWKFRSVNKDPEKVLPPELQESVAADIIQDQISTSNPMAPLIVVPLLDAVDVLQAKPVLVLMPDDEKLGEFREEFANLLGMIEEHPDVPDDDSPAFEEAEKVSGTYKLWETLEKKREHKVNDREFFKARLVDIFVGDWDRHSDQWRWAMYEEDDKKVWYPIPRDRDQAFAKYTGLLPFVAEYLVPQLTTFSYKYPQVEDITWNGRYVDRRFLTELDKSTWDSVTAYVQSRLTDRVIESAVNQLPHEYFEKAGNELISKLKSRRDLLFEISDEYYELINSVVDIFGTDKDDYVEVNRINDNETEVSLYKKDKNTGEKTGEALYYKIFDNNITKEFRIYLMDGDDKVVINGIVNKGPLVRFIGGKGDDELIDNSIVKGYFLSITPFPSAKTKAIVYDTGKDTKIQYGAGTKWDRSKYPEPQNVTEMYEPVLRDRSHDWIAKPLFGFNTDDGFKFGGGPILYSYNFRAYPYEYKMDFGALYATRPKSFSVFYYGDFYSIIKGAHLHLDFYFMQLRLTKYYGFGNNTVFSKELERNNFYQLNQELFTIHPTLNFNLIKALNAGIGLSFNYSEISLENNILLNPFPENSYASGSTRYGLGSFRLFGIHSALNYDSRDNIMNPDEGLYFNLHGSFYPQALSNKEDFSKVGFDVRTYFTISAYNDFTFAFRCGGEKLFGTYPFFKAAFIGGQDNLRGYSHQRFSGDASLFGQAEVRTFLSETMLILNGRFGYLAFIEAGKVFVNGIKSEKWHPSYGGGLWISYLQRKLNFNFVVASSPDKLAFYFVTSFMF